MQIIVYTGAVLMLFLFVLMLVGVDASDSLVETITGQRLMAILGGLLLGASCVIGLSQIDASAPSVGLDDGQRAAATSRRSPTSCSAATSSPSRSPAPC